MSSDICSPIYTLDHSVQISIIILPIKERKKRTSELFTCWAYSVALGFLLYICLPLKIMVVRNKLSLCGSRMAHITLILKVQYGGLILK